MKRRLFLTGDIGAGKSTAIAAALGGHQPRLGGFFTRRNRNDPAQPGSFSLITPDGSREAVFLDFSCGKPELFPEVFETLGVESLRGYPVVLDEIGGVELLNPAFYKALDTLLHSSTPVLGVLKGPGPASALIRTLGLSEEYSRRAGTLWEFLSQDGDTRIYFCEQYDPQAAALARQWVMEFCK